MSQSETDERGRFENKNVRTPRMKAAKTGLGVYLGLTVLRDIPSELRVQPVNCFLLGQPSLVCSGKEATIQSGLGLDPIHLRKEFVTGGRTS